MKIICTDSEARAGHRKLPLALIYWRALSVLPVRIIYSPDALEVSLEAFEGRLHLLAVSDTQRKYRYP